MRRCSGALVCGHAAKAHPALPLRQQLGTHIHVALIIQMRKLPKSQNAMHRQFARVAKGVDLRSTAGNCAWVRTPQLTCAHPHMSAEIAATWQFTTKWNCVRIAGACAITAPIGNARIYNGMYAGRRGRVPPATRSTPANNTTLSCTAFCLAIELSSMWAVGPIPDVIIACHIYIYMLPGVSPDRRHTARRVAHMK